jgi:Na+:H+ antiporter
MDNGSTVTLFLTLAVIIAAAKVAGSVARTLGQPRVFGELLTGLILGPSLLNFMRVAGNGTGELTATIHQLAELGVLLLMFNIGLGVHFDELLSVGRVAMIGGILGALLPVALTLPIVLLFGHSIQTALFAGVVMAATSVSISAQTLLELGVLRTKEGHGLLAMAVVDDVIAILLLSLVVASKTPGEGAGPTGGWDGGQIALILLRMFGFIFISGALAWYVLPAALRWLHGKHIPQGVTAFALVFGLIFGWAAEAIGGIAPITGAFIAGIGLSRLHDGARHEIETSINSIAYGFLVPVFFVNAGLTTNLRQIGLDAIPLAALLLTAAVLSKVVGCGLGARLGGFDNRSALRLGVCMISRGEVGLIIASAGLAEGVLSGEMFPSLFLVILLTTILTPPLVRWAFQNHETKEIQPQRALRVKE